MKEGIVRAVNGLEEDHYSRADAESRERFRRKGNNAGKGGAMYKKGSLFLLFRERRSVTYPEAQTSVGRFPLLLFLLYLLVFYLSLCVSASPREVIVLALAAIPGVAIPSWAQAAGAGCRALPRDAA